MATINDIAKMAGVSVSTVSHVVNKTRYVSPEKVEKVERAIRELETPPNFVLKKKMTPFFEKDGKYIFMLLSDKQSNFQRRVERKIDEKLKSTEYTLVTIECGADIDGMAGFLQAVVQGNAAAGLIVFPDEKDLLIKHVLADARVPVVILGREVEGYLADTVCTDTFEGAYKGTKHLINKGHERIAFLGRSSDRMPMRLEGYKKALEESGIPAEEAYIYPHLQNDMDFFEAMDRLLEKDHMPTAVLLANYAVVTPFLKYISAHNIQCPGDISVVCFDFFEWAPLYTPALTTIEQDVEPYAELAADTLLKRIARQEPANQPAFKEVYKTEALSM